ncbi:DNA-binding transcriptional repressor PuuR [Gimesia alba]|uniref:DNA-binding transcriptional repressor PuuR n=1 Tax=Gimesia alba TaxID=2527973 RepID=A0A517RCQ3_9PLAN|nr:cupin domain-containing protein [Gimesia alba]QDT41661.1 DNA-binding transcriptional repressor PuuR [Gimesia alba]
MSSTQQQGRQEVIVSVNESSIVSLTENVEFQALISGDLGSQGLSTGIAIFQPDAVLPAHVHPVSEVIVPLSGKIHVIVEGRRYVLEQYDALHVPAGLPHWVHSDLSEQPVSCFVAFASEQPTREWVEKKFSIEDCSETNPSSAEHLTRFETASVYELSSGALFRDLFARRYGSRGICGGYGLFQPGASLPCHIHGFDESITIIEGTAVCQVAGSEYELSDCDTAGIPQDRPHRFINRSKRPMAMIWVYAGDEPDRTILEQCCCEEA